IYEVITAIDISSLIASFKFCVGFLSIQGFDSNKNLDYVGSIIKNKENDLFIHRMNDSTLHEYFIDSKFSLFDLDCLQNGMLSINKYVLEWVGDFKFEKIFIDKLGQTNANKNNNKLLLDSERMYSITSRNNASISNLEGDFRWQINIFQQFSKKSRKIKKSDGKTGIFTQNQFSTKSIFYMVIIQKLITNLDFGVIRPLKHKPPFSLTTRNYILG
ncbi:hypothetical protein AGLY_003098, partial [Aphis glycines]